MIRPPNSVMSSLRQRAYTHARARARMSCFPSLVDGLSLLETGIPVIRAEYCIPAFPTTAGKGNPYEHPYVASLLSQRGFMTHPNGGGRPPGPG